MKVKQEIEDIVDLLLGPIEPIKNLLEPFFDIYNIVFDTIKAVKEAYQVLRDGWVKTSCFKPRIITLLIVLMSCVARCKSAQGICGLLHCALLITDYYRYNHDYNGLFRYRKSRSLITKLFGPKAHHRFPRTYRISGGGCASDGFYPTNTDGNYEHQGVDVLMSEDTPVGASLNIETMVYLMCFVYCKLTQLM